MMKTGIWFTRDEDEMNVYSERAGRHNSRAIVLKKKNLLCGDSCSWCLFLLLCYSFLRVSELYKTLISLSVSPNERDSCRLTFVVEIHRRWLIDFFPRPVFLLFAAAVINFLLAPQQQQHQKRPGSSSIYNIYSFILFYFIFLLKKSLGAPVVRRVARYNARRVVRASYRQSHTQSIQRERKTLAYTHTHTMVLNKKNHLSFFSYFFSFLFSSSTWTAKSSCPPKKCWEVLLFFLIAFVAAGRRGIHGWTAGRVYTI